MSQDPENSPKQGFDQAAQAVAGVFDSARHQLDLFSHSLPAQVFDSEPVIQALVAFARRSPKNRGRFLIWQPRLVTSRPHPFLQACQKFPDAFLLHSLPQRMTPPGEDFVLNDASVGLRFPRPGQSLFTHTDGHSQAWLQGVFEELWRHSEPVPELRQFLL